MRKHWSYYFLFTFGLFPTNPAIIFFHVFRLFALWYRIIQPCGNVEFFFFLYSLIGFCWHPEESCYLAEYPVAALYIIRLCIDPSHQSIISLYRKFYPIGVCGRHIHFWKGTRPNRACSRSAAEVILNKDTLRWSPSSSCRLACVWEIWSRT
jgi:hypothetical protein